MSRPDRSPQDERLRRLLAEARHTGPVPTPVADRLDRVLADLADQADQLESTGQGTGTASGAAAEPVEVVDLAARRRRRGRNLLLAAAVVLVVGIGVGQVVGPRDADESGSAGSASAPDAPDDGVSGDAESGLRGEGAGGESSDALPSAPDRGGSSLQQAPEADAVPPARPVTPAVVRPEAFLRDVRRLRSTPGTRVASPTREISEEDLGTGPGFVCDPPVVFGAGRLLPVRYQQQTAVLAYREPSGRTQTVDLLQCGSAAVLRSTTLSLGSGG